MKYAAEKAVSPVSGAVSRVVVDEAYRVHLEATAFLAGVRGRGCSPNTERVYAGRVALYLTWCDGRGLAWSDPGFENLLRFRRWLVETPLPPRGKAVHSVPRFRSEDSANAVLTTTAEFLRFGVPYKWVPVSVAASLSEPRYLRALPSSFSAGEGGRFRQIEARTLKFKTTDHGIEYFTDGQLELMVELAPNVRDRFMIVLMRATAMRIGETLGLRREDMHLLPDSRALGCHTAGPHVHVYRRPENVNGALAKSPKARSIPVEQDVVESYRDYCWEREKVADAADCDMVFVNLYRAPLGRAMSYPNAKAMFDRLARRVGFAARPHMVRHTTATGWVRAGTDRDVVQELLGHACASSMDPYLHASDQDKRDAVENLARGRR